MKATDKEDFARKLNKLALHFGKKLIKDDYAMYWHALQNFKVCDIDRMLWWFNDNRKPSEFYPAPAEMREKVLWCLAEIERRRQMNMLPEPEPGVDDRKWGALGIAYVYQCVMRREEFTSEKLYQYMRDKNCSDEWIQKMRSKYAEDDG